MDTMTYKFLPWAALITVLIISSSRALNLQDCSAVPVNNNVYFNLCPFVRATNFTFTHDQGPDDLTLNISLGGPQVVNCEGEADDKVYATIYDLNEANQCYDVAVSEPNITLLNPNNEEGGLVFTYPLNTANYYGKQLIVTLQCEKSITDTSQAIFSVNDVTEDLIKVSGASSYGCPWTSLSKITKFLQDYRYIFFAIFLILGIFIGFFGLQMVAYTIFIIAAVGVTFLSATIFLGFTSLTTPEWATWLIFVICVIIGCVFGYVAVKIETLGFIALGAVLGVIGGLFLYSAAIAPFLEGSRVIFYIVLVLCGIIGAGIAYKVWKSVVIVATAIIGSYMIVRSISVIFGNFPTEDSIAEGVQSFTPITYAYLGGMVLLALFGGYFQWRRQKEAAFKAEEDPYGYERAMLGTRNL